MASLRTAISADPLNVSELIESASSPSCGAIASFIGIVRATAAVRSNSGKEVRMLSYEAHPTLAPARLDEIANEAAEKWGLERVVAVHRTGECALGEPTVVVACSSPHRADALDACHWIIDEIKASVPIWKKEIYDDESSWVGSELG